MTISRSNKDVSASGIVTQLQHRPVSSSPPIDGQVLGWNAAHSDWEPVAGGGGGGTNAIQLQGQNVSVTVPVDKQLFVWNTSNSQWEPHTISGDATISVTGVLTLKNTGPGVTTSGDATHTNTVVIDAQGRVTGLAANPIAIPESAVTNLVSDLAAKIPTGDVNSSGVVTKIQSNAVAATTPTDAQLLMWNQATPNWGPQSVSGDVAISAAGVVTHANSGVSAGTYGDATHVGQFTVDGKGRITTAASVIITGAAPTGSAGGDLSGNFPTPTVVAIRGKAVASTAPTDGQIHVWVNGSTQYQPKTVTASGDATGTLSNTGALALTLKNTGPGVQTNIGDATHTVQMSTDAQGRVTAATPNFIQIAESQVTNLVADLAAKIPTGDVNSSGVVTKIRGNTVAVTSPTDAQLYLYNTTNSDWEPKSLSGDATISASGVATLKNTGPGATGPLGTAARTNTVTIDARGRVTALTDQAIAIPESAVTNLVTDLAAKVTGGADVSTAGTVTKIQGKNVASTVPTDAQLFIYNTTVDWEPKSLSGDATVSNLGVVTLTNGAGTRTHLGLGSAATSASTAFVASGVDATSAGTVTAIRGNAVKTGAVTTAGAVYAWNTSNSDLEPVVPTLSGDATGSMTQSGGIAVTLKNTGPGVTTIGDATHSAQVTTDVQGRVTALTSIAIAVPESAVTNLVTDLAAKVATGGDVSAAGVVQKIQARAVAATAPTDAQIYIWNNTNSDWEPKSFSGDANILNTGAVVLKNTGPGVTGPLGTATTTPAVTIDAQGRVTALTSVPIQIPESAVTSLVTDLGVLSSRVSSLLVFGHSWAEGFVLNSPGNMRGDLVGKTMSLLSMDQNNVINLGTGGARLTGTGPLAGIQGSGTLNGLHYSSWGTVLQVCLPLTQSAKTSARVNSGRPAVNIFGLNDFIDDYTNFPVTGTNAYKQTMRSVISRQMAALVWDETNAAFTYSGYGTTVASTDMNTGPSYVSSTANGDTVTLTLPADFPGGTVAVCFLAGPGGGGLLNTTMTSSTPGTVNVVVPNGLPAAGTFVGRVGTEEILFTVASTANSGAGFGGGTITYAASLTVTTRAVNGTSAAAHSVNDNITIATDTLRVDVSGTASSASGSIALSGQGQAATPVPVVKRFVLTAADVNKTLIFTNVGRVTGDTSAQFNFDSAWLESSTPPPVLWCNVPRAWFGGVYNNFTPTAIAALNTATATVVAEFPNNVVTVDLDAISANTSATVGTTISSTSSQSITLQAAGGTAFGVTSPLAGHSIRIDSEDMFVTGVSGGSLGSYTYAVTRGFNGTTPATHSAGTWVTDLSFYGVDDLHPSYYGASLFAQQIASTLLTTLGVMGKTAPAFAGSVYSRKRDQHMLSLVDGWWMSPMGVSTAPIQYALGTSQAAPIYIPEIVVVTAASVTVTTGQTGAFVRLGLYLSDRSGGRPGDLLVDWGATSAATSGAKTISGLGTVLEPGWYWTVCVPQSSTAGTSPTLTCLGTIPGQWPTVGAGDLFSGWLGVLQATSNTVGLSNSWGTTFSPGFGSARVNLQFRAHMW